MKPAPALLSLALAACAALPSWAADPAAATTTGPTEEEPKEKPDPAKPATKTKTAAELLQEKRDAEKKQREVKEKLFASVSAGKALDEDTLKYLKQHGIDPELLTAVAKGPDRSRLLGDPAYQAMEQYLRSRMEGPNGIGMTRDETNAFLRQLQVYNQKGQVYTTTGGAVDAGPADLTGQQLKGILASSTPGPYLVQGSPPPAKHAPKPQVTPPEPPTHAHSPSSLKVYVSPDGLQRTLSKYPPIDCRTSRPWQTLEERTAQQTAFQNWAGALITDLLPFVGAGKDWATLGGVNPDKALGFDPEGKPPTPTDKAWAAPGVIAGLLPAGRTTLKIVRSVAETMPTAVKAVKATRHADDVVDAAKLPQVRPKVSASMPVRTAEWLGQHPAVLQEQSAFLKGVTPVKLEESFRGVGVEELGRIVNQKGMVPHSMQPGYSGTRFMEALKDKWSGWMIVEHTRGFTPHFVGVTADIKIAESYATQGAVLRVRGFDGAETARYSSFGPKSQGGYGHRPEQEFITRQPISSTNIDIRTPSGEWVPLESELGQSIARRILKR